MTTTCGAFLEGVAYYYGLFGGTGSGKADEGSHNMKGGWGVREKI